METQEKEAALKLLAALVETDTQNPPGSERELALYIAGCLKDTNAETELCELGQNRANVVARIRGEGAMRPLVLCGHMDTVPCGDLQKWRYPPIRLTEKEGRLYGRGTCDMKGGLAAILYAFREYALKAEKPKGDIILLATADEEDGGEGAKDLAERLNLGNAAAVVIAEPTGNQIGLASKGVMWLSFEISGRTSHAAYPERGINAVMLAYEFASELAKLCGGPPHEYLTAPTCTLTGISGGIKTNMVPDKCSATLDIRTIPCIDHGQLLDGIKAEADKLCAKYPGASVEFRADNNRPAIGTDKDEEIVRKLFTIRDSVCGGKTEYIGTGFFSDASVFVKAWQVPYVLFGPGLPELAHTPNEYVGTDAYLNSVQCYRQLIGSYYSS